MSEAAFLDRLTAALGSVTSAEHTVPLKNYAVPKTTLNYSEIEVKQVVNRVLDKIRANAKMPVTLLTILGASKQGDSMGTVWYDICFSIFDVQRVVVREVEMTAVIPSGGLLYVTKCNLTSRNTATWGLPDTRETGQFAPFREVGT
jgi:hypothetical protein